MAYNEKARATVAAKQAAKAAAAAQDATTTAPAVAPLTAEVFHVEQAQQVESIADRIARLRAEAESLEQQAFPGPTAEEIKAAPPNLFSGTMPRLAVYTSSGDPNNPFPGFYAYWFNDIEGGARIGAALKTGYVFVKRSECVLGDDPTWGKNTDLGDNVKEFVENGPGGAPTYAYLMKKPLWLHELHENEPESRENRIHARVESELRSGTLNQSPGDGRYTPGNMPAGMPASTLGETIKLNTKYLRPTS